MQGSNGNISSGSGTNSLRKLRRDWWKTKLCSSCVSPLGRIISRGGNCPKCGLRVCKNCRSEIQPGSGTWVCVLCDTDGIVPDIFGKTKSLGRDSRSIRRSWSVSNSSRDHTNSPVLKSYTILHPEESFRTGESFTGTEVNLANGTKSSRQFSSLPDRSKKVKRSFNQEFEKENIKRHRSFQSTLHPYQAGNPPSPTASINFIEDPFWDYYDYDIDEESPLESHTKFRSLTSVHNPYSSTIEKRNSIRHKLAADMDRLLKLNLRTDSNRSSCERSLGETFDYNYSKSYGYNYSSFSDTELNENYKHEAQQTSPRRFSTENTHFYRFATVTPINLSPISDTRRTNFPTPGTNKSTPTTPAKPERKCNMNTTTTKNKRSLSLNSYDGKKLFSPLKTYVVVMKENFVPKSNNINSDASITSDGAGGLIVPHGLKYNKAEENNANDSKIKNNFNNTSTTVINSSVLKQRHEIYNSATKFHSLPRERVIRIEKEVEEVPKPNLQERGKNVSKVEITRSASSVGNVTKVPITGGDDGRQILRSQSFREISSHDKAGRERDTRTGTTFRERERYGEQMTLTNQKPKLKPLLNSLLDDKETATMLENFLKSSTRDNQSSASGVVAYPSSYARTLPIRGRSANNNEKKSNTSHQEEFEKEKTETFDYLRQCSTFPRALHKQKIEHEPRSPLIRHTSTTLINYDNSVYLPKTDLQSASKSFHADENENGERILPSFFGKSYPGASATLPHPYIRKQKQSKSSFISQPDEVDTFSKEKTRILSIEKEIERDIYFQRTKSLDRQKRKTEFFENSLISENCDPIPIPSPRTRRKPTSATTTPKSSPKIEECINGTGTNHQEQINMNRILVANDPKTPTSPSQFLKPTTSHSNSSFDQSQFNRNKKNNSNSNTANANSPVLPFSDMKIPQDPITSSTSPLQTTLPPPPPVATPRTRRKNQSQNQNSSNDLHNGINPNNKCLLQSPKAVRFEPQPHIIVMEENGETGQHNHLGGNRKLVNKPTQHLDTFHHHHHHHYNPPHRSPRPSFTSNHQYPFDPAAQINPGYNRKKKSGFVARAIAKVKGGKRKKPFQNKLRFVETRDSITYISPPPTSTTIALNGNPSLSYNPIRITDDELGDNTAPASTDSKISDATAETEKLPESIPTTQKVAGKSPAKPRRSSLKKSVEEGMSGEMISPSPIPPPPLSEDDEDYYNRGYLFSSPTSPSPPTALAVDQLTPSSTSSSASSSYSSHLQESYDFFHGSDGDLDLTPDVEEADEGNHFKSFDAELDDDFIFYRDDEKEDKERIGMENLEKLDKMKYFPFNQQQVGQVNNNGLHLNEQKDHHRLHQEQQQCYNNNQGGFNLGVMVEDDDGVRYPRGIKEKETSLNRKLDSKDEKHFFRGFSKSEFFPGEGMSRGSGGREGSPELPVIQRYGKKSVTTVDLSGDVGIVNSSDSAREFLNSRRALLKKVNKDLWEDRGARTLETEEATTSSAKKAEEKGNGVVEQEVKSGGKSECSDDGDWSSESTKNTVICATEGSAWNDCTPEIRISDIIVGGSHELTAEEEGTKKKDHIQIAGCDYNDVKRDGIMAGAEIVELPDVMDVKGSANAKSCPRLIPSGDDKEISIPKRRESPEGQEQELPSVHQDSKQDKKHLELGEVIIMENPRSEATISKSKISQNALSQISRSSPDGADAERSETTGGSSVGDSPTPIIEHFEVTSDEDSWVEETIFEDDDTEIQMCKKVQPQPPPLDLTLHTIVEESCEESEPESGHFANKSINRKSGACNNQKRIKSTNNENELEKYFNFGTGGVTSIGDNSSQYSDSRHSFTNEESEFSDSFSESSYSMQDQDDNEEVVVSANGAINKKTTEVDPADLASSRLEKYFYNLGLPQSMINPISSINHIADSDSVGSESESDNSVLEKRKKVLKHHRRSVEFEDELGGQVSDEEGGFGFGQDGFDTIKKTARKSKKTGSENNILDNSGDVPLSFSSTGSSKFGENILSIPSRSSSFTEQFSKASSKAALAKTSSNETNSSKDELEPALSSPNDSKKSSSTGEKDVNTTPTIKVNRSNSFQWSSDEEVNIMMSKLRQLIRNLVKSKTDQNSNSSGKRIPRAVASEKDKQLAYLEGELIRLMKTENLKNIVEYFSSEESDVDDVYKFIKVVKQSGGDGPSGELGEIDLEDPMLFQTLQTTMQSGSSHDSPKGSPALLAKVMNHIGNRLSVWMKDENMQDEDNNDDNVTLKCAQSVSSDLNEDRFSWKGSFESALAAKRQSCSTDSLSSLEIDRSILRSSSLHHLANSSHHLGQVEEHKEEEEGERSSLRMTNLCNSLPRLNQPNNLSISRAQSLVISPVRSESESPTTPSPGPIKSARYRPPGFQPKKSKRVDDDDKNTSISQSTPALSQDPGHLKVRSDSMGSIFHDPTKSHIVVKGQVEFGLQYNYKLACMEVRVKGCIGLAPVDLKRNRSDPYVKAYLLPDRSKSGKRKTKAKKNTLNPVFDEILKFPVTLSDLQNRTLWLSVWHSDTFGKNEFLGEVLVDLKDRVFDEINPQLWDLQEMSGQTEDMPRGDLSLALKWQPKCESTGSLSVLVKEAKNLTPVRNGGSPSSFIKCSLLSDKSKKLKSKSKSKSKNHTSIVWNQTLTFEDAGDDGIEITLWNHDLLSNNELLGTVRIEYDHPLWASMLSRHSFWVEGITTLT